MTDQDFLASLKEGSRVIIKTTYLSYKPTYDIATVLKITPTGLIRVDITNKPFKNGMMSIGDYFHRLIPVTDELVEFIERSKIVKICEECDWKRMSIEKLRLIRGILEGEN